MPGATAKDEKPAVPRVDTSTILVRFANATVAKDRVRAAGDRSAGLVANRVHIVKLGRGRTPKQALSSYRGRAGVVYAELNYIRSIDVAAPNDPSYNSQWGLHAINALDAWNLYPNAYSIGVGPPVAVLDTGVDSSHPDLAANVDTANGASCFNTCIAGPALDNHFHGTHVAGIVGAVTNNGVGVAGTAFSSRVIPVKVLAANGSGEDAGIANGILWAASHGAKVINLSLGGYGFNQTLCDAVTTATNAGALVVAAAGNDGISEPSYPASCPGAVGVAATDVGGFSPEWSNWDSPNVFLSAPGVDILSTIWPGSGYAALQGTSMASPHVAGVAALLKGQNPARTPAQLKQILAATAEKVGADFYPPFGYGADPYGVCSCSWHPFYGYGELDAAAALAFSVPPTIASMDTFMHAVGATVTLTGTAFSTASSVTLGGVSAPFVVATPTTILATVPFDVAFGRWRVTTPAGTATSPHVFTVRSPSLTGIGATTGPAGSTVHLLGSNFSGAESVTSVSLGGVPAPFFVSSPSLIVAEVPAGVPFGRWSVANDHWSSTYPDVFTVATDPWAPFTFSPTVAPVGGSVVLRGRFGNATGMTFGGVPTTFTVDGPKQATAVVPTGVAYGKWRVSIAGQVYVNDLVGSVTAPVISSFTGPTGPAGGSVVIAGTGFGNATSVTLGNVAAPFTVDSPTQITATVPGGVEYGRWRVSNSFWTAGHPLVFTVTS